MPQPRPTPALPEPLIVVSDEARRMIISLAARSVVATEACLRDPGSAECQEANADEDREIAALSRYIGGLEAQAKVNSSPYARCSICSAPLDVPGRPWSQDCGRDCIACMAEAGDPECAEAIAAMRAGEAVVKAARALVTVFYAQFNNGEIGEPAFKLLDALCDALPPEKGEEE